MEELLVGLAKDSPWVAIVLYYIWQAGRREGSVLQAFKEGAESAKSVAAATESLESSIGSMQSASVELRAEVMQMRTELQAFRAEYRK